MSQRAEMIIGQAKKTVREVYRKTLYPSLKRFEGFSQIGFLSLFSFCFPKAKVFQIFGIPMGAKMIACSQQIDNKKEYRQLPQTIESIIHPRFQEQIVESEGGYSALVKEGYALSSGAHLSDKGALLLNFTESFTSSEGKRHKLFTFRWNRTFQKIPFYEQSVASLAIDCGNNYYHWLFDALPKLWLLNKAGLKPERYYTYAQKAFQVSSLELLGIDKAAMISAEKEPVIQAKSLYVTSFPCQGALSSWATQALRSWFLPHVKGKKRRLFISRSGAQYRRIQNENELLPILEKEGFEIVQPEKLTFQEQITLFSQADYVIAPHGAGLSNLVFCPEGAKVIELFPPRFPCICYWHLSQLVKLKYAYLFGENDPKTFFPSPYPGEGPYDDLTLDPKKLHTLIKTQSSD